MVSGDGLFLAGVVSLSGLAGFLEAGMDGSQCEAIALRVISSRPLSSVDLCTTPMTFWVMVICLGSDHFA